MYVEKLPNGKFKCVQRYKDYLTGKIKRVSVTIDKDDIVNIGWHIYLKDITAYAASPRDS